MKTQEASIFEKNIFPFKHQTMRDISLKSTKKKTCNACSLDFPLRQETKIVKTSEETSVGSSKLNFLSGNH